ncbi:MAG: F0F1 ATP synthase subunit B, partial [Anaerolineae bacterium]
AAVAAQENGLDQARRDAEQIVADGQADAEQARSGVIAQAKEEAERIEAAMTQHLDRAVQFVLKQVTGQA